MLELDGPDLVNTVDSSRESRRGQGRSSLALPLYWIERLSLFLLLCGLLACAPASQSVQVAPPLLLEPPSALDLAIDDFAAALQETLSAVREDPAFDTDARAA